MEIPHSGIIAQLDTLRQLYSEMLAKCASLVISHPEFSAKRDTWGSLHSWTLTMWWLGHLVIKHVVKSDALSLGIIAKCATFAIRRPQIPTKRCHFYNIVSKFIAKCGALEILHSSKFARWDKLATVWWLIRVTSDTVPSFCEGIIAKCDTPKNLHSEVLTKPDAFATSH